MIVAKSRGEMKRVSRKRENEKGTKRTVDLLHDARETDGGPPENRTGIMLRLSFFLPPSLSLSVSVCLSGQSTACLSRYSFSSPYLTRGPAGLDSYAVPSRTQCELLRHPRVRTSSGRGWRQRRPTWSSRGCINPFAVSCDRTTTPPAPN